MSAQPELARFDTRRAAQNDEHSEQTDFRTIGAREQGQLALNEIGAVRSENQASSKALGTTSKPTRSDLEAALGCAHTRIDGLREQVAQLEAERDRLREETEAEGDR